MLAEEGKSRGFISGAFFNNPHYNQSLPLFVIIDSSTMIFDAAEIHYINIIRSGPSKHLNVS
jgi:hypothetical protein